MRQAVIDAIAALSLGTFQVSESLPWSSQGENLAIRNFRTIYVDEPESRETAILNTLDGGTGLAQRVTEISAQMAVDAKQQPSNFVSLVQSITQCRNSADLPATVSRECDVTHVYQDDVLITTFQFRFRELVTP